MIKFNPITYLMASLENMGMVVSVLLRLNSLSIMYQLFNTVSE